MVSVVGSLSRVERGTAPHVAYVRTHVIGIHEEDQLNVDTIGSGEGTDTVTCVSTRYA